MCGIAGIFDKVGHRDISPDKLAILSNGIEHRGRDDIGYYVDKGCGLVHRRLSILDPKNGHQPMLDETRNYIIILNGMIYNFQELRQHLSLAGHHFKTNTDTEVLLKSYIAWGADCVKYLDGFFAFAIYDKSKNILFCAKDNLGKKPFYYYIDNDNFFYFASDLSSLLNILPSKAAISSSALSDYLTYGFNAGVKTLFQGIYRLEAGHSLLIKRNYDKLQFKNFSKEKIHQNFNQITDYSEALQQTEKLLDAAVDKRLIADVPIGTLLSGGLDSSLITAMIAKKTDKITAFTAGFLDKNLDEALDAKALAQHLGVKHETLHIGNPSENIIDEISVIAGEPFADAAILPLFMICNKAKEYVKVLISGDGGDELFAGYKRYQSFIIQEQIKSFLSLETRQFLFQKLANIYPQNLKIPQFLRFGATFEALATTPQEGYLRNIAITRSCVVQNVLSDNVKEKLDNYNPASHLACFFEGHTSKDQDIYNYARYADLKLWLPERMLIKADRASMAASTELRSPLLDIELTAYALQLPYDFLKHKLGGKRILRDIAKKYIPDKYLTNPKKGFVMPINHLLKTSWANRLEAVVNSPSLSNSGLFNMHYLKTLKTEHLSGYQDNSRILWAIIQLESFLRHHKYL